MTRVLLALMLGATAFALPAAAGPNDVNGRIAYERRGSLGGTEIWTMNQDGTTLRRLAPGADPAWSSDGRRLAYVARSGSLATIGADGTDMRVLEVAGLPPDHRGRILQPAWSPDGSTIAFGTVEGLHVVPATGGPAQLVAAAFEAAPSWSPDGSMLSFVGSGSSVEIVRADGSGRRAIPGARSYPGRRVGWSPDGATLAFGDAQTGGIATVGLDGRPPRQIVPYPGGSETADAVWSPDGRRIAFVDNNTDVCVVNADGSGLGRLTYAPMDAANVDPAWQPLPSGAAPAGPPGSRPGPVENWDRDESWGWACERRQAGRALTASVSPTRVSVGGVVTYRVRVENRGSAPVGEHGIASVYTAVDGGARLLSATSSRGRCLLRRAECDLRSIFPGERLLVTLRVRVLQPGEILFESGLPWAASIAPPSQGPDAVARVAVKGCTMTGSGRADLLDGSPRADVLCGLRGNDRIRPGAGRDAIYAGAGDDVVHARDGAVDRVFCGTGKDAAIADRNDRVGRDCERVTRS